MLTTGVRHELHDSLVQFAELLTLKHWSSPPLISKSLDLNRTLPTKGAQWYCLQELQWQHCCEMGSPFALSCTLPARRKRKITSFNKFWQMHKTCKQSETWARQVDSYRKHSCLCSMSAEGQTSSFASWGILMPTEGTGTGLHLRASLSSDFTEVARQADDILRLWFTLLYTWWYLPRNQ